MLLGSIPEGKWREVLGYDAAALRTTVLSMGSFETEMVLENFPALMQSLDLDTSNVPVTGQGLSRRMSVTLSKAALLLRAVLQRDLA